MGLNELSGAGEACLARSRVGGAEGKYARAARGTQDLSLVIWVIVCFLGGLLKPGQLLTRFLLLSLW